MMITAITAPTMIIPVTTNAATIAAVTGVLSPEEARVGEESVDKETVVDCGCGFIIVALTVRSAKS